MKHMLIVLGLISVVTLLAGCITMQEIKPPKSGSDQTKVARFDYMGDKWSYLNNTWISGERVYSEDLVRLYKIPEDQAKSEMREFVNLQREHSGFRRFMLSIYVDHFEYYVD